MSSAIEWISQYGNETQEFVTASISANEKGDVYAIGSSMGEYAEVLLAKYSNNGVREWSVNIGPPEILNYGDIECVTVADGVLIASGNSLRKFNTSGHLEWESNDSANVSRLSVRSLARDKSGAIFVYGALRDQNPNIYNTDLYIAKYTPDGEQEWRRLIGSQSQDVPHRIQINNQGAVYISGRSQGVLLGQSEPGWFSIELDELGNPASVLSVKSPHVHDILDFVTDSMGNIYLIGSSRYGNSLLLFSKISKQGDTEWIVPVKDFYAYGEWGDPLVYLVDNNTIAIGVTDLDVHIISFDSDGRELSYCQFGTYQQDGIFDMSRGGDGEIFIAGLTNGNLSGNSNLGTPDIFVAKLELLSENNLPDGKPTLYGIFKAGQKLRINTENIADADNYAGFYPSYHYEWEYSDNGGDTWQLLGSADAVDGDAFYTLGKQDVGKLVRGSVSYADGRGTTETLKTLFDLVTEVSANVQEVLTSKVELGYSPSKNITIPLQYRTSTGDSQLSGLTLNVHYNSNILTPGATNNGISDQIPAAITSTKVIQDTNDLDNDPLTDKIIQMVWATFDNSFPNKTLPTTLANVTFNTSSQSKDPVTGEPLTTTLRYTASETASEYDFITNSTTLKATTFTLDVDGDGQVKALTDGLMVIRKLLGPAFDGDALTFKAIGSGATRTTEEIHDYIQSGIDSGLLDVDKNGKTTALTDGLMVIRRLLGPAFDGEALTFKALASDSPYFGPPADFNAVASNIDSLLPTVI